MTLTWVQTTKYQARARTTRHRSRPVRLDVNPDPYDSTSTRVCTTRHQLGPARIEIDPGLLGSTSVLIRLARDHSTRHQSAQLDIDPGRLGSISALACSTQQCPKTGQLNNSLSLDSRPGPVGLDINLGPYDSTSIPTYTTQHRLDISLGPLDSTSSKAQTTRHQACRLDIDPVP